MKQRMTALLLLLLMLVPAAGAAGTEVSDNRHRYGNVSPWAVEGVTEAMDLGLAICPRYEDAKTAIYRRDFAENAAALVALAYGTDLTAYENYTNLVCQRDGTPYQYAYETLHILQGRENGDLDEFGLITRQEAAVMLARAYRIYCHEEPTAIESLPYQDAASIADWAKEDVALITHLGIMNGVENRCFDPQGTYTVEQCLVTLARMYHLTCQGKTPDGTNPFPLTQREEAIGTAWRAGYLRDYIETDDLVVISTASGKETPTDIAQRYLTVVDKDLNGATYRNVIKYQYNTFFGEGGQDDAEIENLTISEDGTKVFFQSTLTEDVYPYNPDGTYGELMFRKGIYSVTLDVATGQQTYTRADLPAA